MANLHKEQYLVFALQGDTDVVEAFDGNSPVLPVDELEWTKRGDILERTEVQFGMQGSMKPVAGRKGWSFSFGSEVHDSSGVIPNTLMPLLACGFKAVEGSVGTVEMFLSPDCKFQAATGTLPVGPCLASAALVESCGVTRIAQNSAGTATFEMESGERAKVNYEFLGLLVQSGVANDSIKETSATELGWGNREFESLPYVCEAMSVKVDDDELVQLSELEINLNLNSPETVDMNRYGGFSTSEPKLDGYIEVSFNVAQDETNRKKYMDAVFSDSTFDFELLMAGPDGGSLKIEMKNLRFSEVDVEEDDGRRRYGITALGFIAKEDVNTPETALRNLFLLTYEAP